MNSSDSERDPLLAENPSRCPPSRSDISWCEDYYIRLWQGLVVTGTLVILSIFVVANGQATDFSYAVNTSEARVDHGENCSVDLGRGQNKFEDLVSDTSNDVIYTNIRVRKTHILNGTTFRRSLVYHPMEWLWTKEHAALPRLPTDYEQWLPWMIDHSKQKKFLHISLSFHPHTCVFGSFRSLDLVGEKLLNMTRGKANLKHSHWCYSVKLNKAKRYPLFQQSFGFFVQNVGYRCCKFEYEDSGAVQPTCDNVIVDSKMWTVYPFVFVLLILFVSPLIVSFVCQTCTSKSHACDIRSSGNGNPKKDDEWTYSDYVSSITFLSFKNRHRDTLCELATRNTTQDGDGKSTRLSSANVKWGLLKGACLSLCLVIFSFSVIIFALITLSQKATRTIKRRIESGIPVGFFSLLFSWDYNHNNFLPFMNGPYVFVSLYGIIAFPYFFIITYYKPVENIRTYMRGRFTLNLDLVEKYGRLHYHSYPSICETTSANTRAIFCFKFWCALMKRLVGEIRHCSDVFPNVFRLMVQVSSVLFSGFVHLSPLLFASSLIFTHSTHAIRLGGRLRYLVVFILSALHLWLVFSIILIYFASAEIIVTLVVSCILSLVRYPGTMSGLFIFIFVELYYVVERFCSIGKKYAMYRDLVVSVSKEICDKCKGVEARFSENRTRINIRGIDMNMVRNISLVAGCQNAGTPMTLWCRSRHTLHCHNKDETLKILTCDDCSTLEYIAINGILVKVTFGTNQKENLFQLCVDSDSRELKLVSVSIHQANNRPHITREDDTCYVTYRNGHPGIPTELLDKVVDIYLPSSAERIQAILMTLPRTLLITWLATVVSEFGQWDQLSAIINALSAVVLVRVTRIFEVFSSHVTEAQKTELLKGELRLIVHEYWTKEQYKCPENAEESTETSAEQFVIQ